MVCSIVAYCAHFMSKVSCILWECVCDAIHPCFVHSIVANSSVLTMWTKATDTSRIVLTSQSKFSNFSVSLLCRSYYYCVFGSVSHRWDFEILKMKCHFFRNTNQFGAEWDIAQHSSFVFTSISWRKFNILSGCALTVLSSFYCSPFLRTATAIRSHLYGEDKAFEILDFFRVNSKWTQCDCLLILRQQGNCIYLVNQR